MTPKTKIPQAVRQQIIEDYLNQTGANALEPELFLDWLKPQTSHIAWHRFFGKTDAEAAQMWRVSQVRSFVSDVRINAIIPDAFGKVQTRPVPAYTASVAAKSEYVAFDPDDPAAREIELARGLSVLRAVHKRYGGVAEKHGFSLDAELGAAIVKWEAHLP